MKQNYKELTLDIETSHAVWASFRGGEQRLTIDQMLEDSSIFMIQWKWGHEKDVHTLDITQDKNYRKDWRNDYILAKKASELLNEADVVIGQNSKRFDTKWLNAKIAKYGLPPASGYTNHDTLIVARKNYNLTSYKLHYLGTFFGFGGKLHTDLSWWMELLTSSRDKDWDTFEKRIAKFKQYGKRDVLLVRQVYGEMCKTCPEFKLIGITDSPDKCTQPGCTGKMTKNGTRVIRTAQQMFQRYVCNKCGISARGSKGLIKQQDRLQ